MSRKRRLSFDWLEPKLALSGLIAIEGPQPTQPGDPVGEPPGGGTDPAPPDGDGTPPKNTPSIPGGPDNPALVENPIITIGGTPEPNFIQYT